jgi:hypothetical protein
MDQLVRRWFVGQQVREDFSRCFRKKGVLVGPVREQRYGQRGRLGGIPHFVADAPEGHTSVAWKQDHVAPLRPVEARRVFAVWVVHNRDFVPLLDLQKLLNDELRFAGRGVPHDLEVAVLFEERNMQFLVESEHPFKRGAVLIPKADSS